MSDSRISSLLSRLATAAWDGLFCRDGRLLLLVLVNSAMILALMSVATISRPGILTTVGADTHHYIWISRTLYHGWEETGCWSPEGGLDPGGKLYAFAHFPMYLVVFGTVSVAFLLDRLTAAFAVTFISSNLLLIVFYKLALIRGKQSVLYPMLLIATNYEIPLQSVLATYVLFFLLLVFGSYLFFAGKRLGVSALLAGMAQATHFTAWALFPGYVVSVLLGKRKRASLYYLSIPIALLLVFLLFWARSGNLYAYLEYNAGHPAHHYYPFATFLGFLTSQDFSIWNKGLVLFSTAAIVVGAMLLLRERRYPPAIIGLSSLLAAASIGPFHGFPRYAMPAMICLLGFTRLDLEKRRWAWLGVVLLAAATYAYAFQAILTKR